MPGTSGFAAGWGGAGRRGFGWVWRLRLEGGRGAAGNDEVRHGFDAWFHERAFHGKVERDRADEVAWVQPAGDDHVVAFSPCDGDLAAAEFLILVDGEDGIAFADGDAWDHVDIREGFAGDFGTDPCADLKGRGIAAAATVGVVDLSGDVELSAAGVDAAGGAHDASFPFA